MGDGGELEGSAHRGTPLEAHEGSNRAGRLFKYAAGAGFVCLACALSSISLPVRVGGPGGRASLLGVKYYYLPPKQGVEAGQTFSGSVDPWVNTKNNFRAKVSEILPEPPVPLHPKGGQPDLAIDHLHFEDSEHRRGWANVYGYDGLGNLMTGQIRFKKKAVHESPPPPEDVGLVNDITDNIEKGITDAIFRAAFPTPAPTPPPTPLPTPAPTPAPTPPPPPPPPPATPAPTPPPPPPSPAPPPPKPPPTTTPPPPPPKTSPKPSPKPRMPETPAPTPPPATTTPAPVPHKEEKCEDGSGKTFQDCCCDFPFSYAGETYKNTCTEMDHPNEWCYTKNQCGFKEQATGHYWDDCTRPKKGPPLKSSFHHVGPPPYIPPTKPRFCGDTTSHWTQPWHFDDVCTSGVCNYRCKNPLFCPSCEEGNCQCVPMRELGETCGDGTNRGPEYSHRECLSGQCVFNCAFCKDCNGGNCICGVTQEVEGPPQI